MPRIIYPILPIKKVGITVYTKIRMLGTVALVSGGTVKIT